MHTTITAQGMNNKWMGGPADVATGKRQIKSADIKCTCVSKRWMCE